MKTVTSNTLVKNGMPFIGLVLRQVEPFMTKMIITISELADDETIKEVLDFKKDFSEKAVIRYEHVKSPGELTLERQKMKEMSISDWILFLDDDDYWPEESLYWTINLLNLNSYIDGIASHAIQLVDEKTWDYSWRYKWFTKWLPNEPGLHYVGEWPKDIIMMDDRPLYWRQNWRTLRVPFPHIHLSHLKKWSFRDEDWAKESGWVRSVGKKVPLENYLEDAKRIMKYANRSRSVKKD